MPVIGSDVVLLLSAPGASSGHSVGSSAGNSLGKFASTTVLSGTPLNNLFTDITGAENAADQVDYQCLFVWNNTGSGDSMVNVVAWLPTASDVSGGATVAVGVDPAAASSVSSGSQQAAVIVSSTIAPTGVNTWYATSSTNSGGVALGTIAPGFARAVWIRRTAANSAALNNDGFGIQIDFDTSG